MKTNILLNEKIKTQQTMDTLSGKDMKKYAAYIHNIAKKLKQQGIAITYKNPKNS